MSKKRKPSFDLHSLLVVGGDEQPHSHSSNNKNNSNSNRIDLAGSSTTITNISNSGTTNDTSNNNKPSAIDHLDALGNAYDEVSISTDSMRNDDHNHSHTHVESSKMALSSSGRERAESWGGMSDISATAAVASALHQTGIIDDVTAAAAAMEIPSPTLGPIHHTTSSIANNSSRCRLDSFSDIIRRTDRLESLASLSEFHNHHHYRPRTQSIASLSEASMTMSLAAVEDLANLANDLEYIIETNQTHKHQQKRKFSDASLSNLSLPPPQQPTVTTATSTTSTAQISSAPKPTVAVSNTVTKPSTPQTPAPTPAPVPKPAPAPLPSATISVDSDAVKAAVDAAMSVTLSGIFDMAALCTPNPSLTAPTNPQKTNTQTEHIKSTVTKPVSKKPPKPKSILSKPTMPKPQTHKSSPLAPISKMSTKTTPSSNKQQKTNTNINNTVILAATNTTAAALRDRARAAAGYIPPTPNKRQKFTALEPPNRLLSSTITTPATPVTKIKPASTIFSSPNSFSTPKRKNTSNNTTSNNVTPVSTSKGGQSNQKWDDMLQCLLQYIIHQREKETKDMLEDEKKEWTWDGNVPTTYKVSSYVNFLSFFIIIPIPLTGKTMSPIINTFDLWIIKN